MPHPHAKIPIGGSYSCRPSEHDGRLEILNENSYVMGEYNRRTGLVTWERMVLATQREAIQRWFAEHYPVVKPAESTVVAKTTRQKSS